MILCGQACAAFRGDASYLNFTPFLAGRMHILTGRISGSAALVQIASMPVGSLSAA
jgi:hypothetical protein